jgi:hypothetical protein
MGNSRFHARALAVAAALSVPAFAPTSLAAPTVSSVSGTVGQGQTITISGSAFGTKPQANPVVYDDFEAGTVGGKVEGRSGVTGQWGTGDWSYNVTYSNTQPMQGSRAAHHSFGSGTYNASLYVDPQQTGTYYLDFWMRVVPKSSSLTRNFKPWRMYDNSDNTIANDVIFCDSPGWVGLESGGGAWVSRPRVWNQWEHYQIVVKVGSNGIISQHRDGIADIERTGITAGGNPTAIRIGHYWALDGADACVSNPGADIYTDNVYVDTSLARVVLGDASTYANSRNRAILRPTQWSGSQITASVNTAKFASGAQAYLFVIDSANAPSPGFPVTIGQGSVTPNPPTNVSAN